MNDFVVYRSTRPSPETEGGRGASRTASEAQTLCKLSPQPGGRQTKNSEIKITSELSFFCKGRGRGVRGNRFMLLLLHVELGFINNSLR